LRGRPDQSVDDVQHPEDDDPPRFVALDHGDKTYRLGLALAELAAGFVGVGQVALVHPQMERLAADYAMLIVLWRMTDDGHMAG
jgi:DNA-binding IclR family transcriptional regulator